MCHERALCTCTSARKQVRTILRVVPVSLNNREPRQHEHTMSVAFAFFPHV